MSFLDFFDQVDSYRKPWMDSKIMELVTAESLSKVIDSCIQVPKYALDLETTGLDSRVFNGKTVDRIVGVCLSPDGVRGFYIPLRHRVIEMSLTGKKETMSEHNIPMSIFRSEFQRLMNAESKALFHNAKFDQEFLEFNEGEAFGNWDDLDSWEDTLILAYLENVKRKAKGLKVLSKELLDIEQLELAAIFPEGHQGDLDFSLLDPSEDKVIWYGAGDAIATYLLHDHYEPLVLSVGGMEHPQDVVYKIEKGCVISTRWMERNRILIDIEKVKDLILIGHQEFFEAIFSVYDVVSESLNRNVMPHFFQMWRENCVLDDPHNTVTDQIKRYAVEAQRTNPDVNGKVEKKGKKYPYVYDVLSAQQLGVLLEELEVPGLRYTEKSKQVKTTKDEMERILEEQGEKFEFMGKIKRFREVQKALSTYLYPLFQDTDPTDNTIKINFNAHKVDTGRFSTPGQRRGKGGTRYNLQSTPANYDKNRPKCMQGIRDCFIAPEDFVFAAVDLSGIELRMITNVSHEPKWIDAFFRCTTCKANFPKEESPPQFCPSCGSDKVGDIHTLSAMAFFGEDVVERPDFKKLRGDAKATNFSLSYGGSSRAVMNSIGCDKAEGQRIKRQFDKAYDVLARWYQRQWAFARKYKYIRNVVGRKCPLPDIDHEDGGFRSKAERNATNFPIQSVSADLMKQSMWEIYKAFKDLGWLDRAKMIITMHDELCFLLDLEVAQEALHVIRDKMTLNNLSRHFQAIPKRSSKHWPIPLFVDPEIGKSWSVPHNYYALCRDENFPDWMDPHFDPKLLPEYSELKDTIQDSSVEKIEKFVHTLHPKDLVQEKLEWLAEVIEKSCDKNGKMLTLFTSLGEKIGTVSVRVNEDTFRKLTGDPDEIYQN